MAEKETPKATEYVELKHEFFDRFKDKDVSFKFHFKRPSTPQVNRVQKTVLKNAGQAFRNLIVETIQPEEKDRLKTALDEYSGLASTFGGALMGSCGFGDLGN
ncbi:hypothetical protein [Pseudodesulfovibrio methanolicus]|uniref:DUF6848 domain-containing protein n=1 Tax=Pseudodesulfovibrio methanolicus TaxID=3126690 RepID=A0ABZ2J346_9BACT